MQSKMMKMLERLLVLLVSLVAVIASSFAQVCDYKYSRQPPTVLTCNPYDGANRLRLTCSVEGPNFPRFTVIWFRRVSSGDEQLRDSQQGVTIDVTETSVAGGTAQFIRRSSLLELTGLNQADVGDYWCQVRLNNGSSFQERSSMLTLNNEAVYDSFGISRCMGSQVVVQEKCLTLQTMVPTVTDSGAPSNSGFVFQSTVPPSDLSPTPQTTGGSIEETQKTGKNLVALYAVIAVIVVFCVVIVTLTIIIVVLYRKKCGPVRFKTEDHKQTPNPYSGFTSRERANSNQSNGMSKGERSSSRLTNSGQHQQQNVGSPASFNDFSEEEPYSRLMRDQLHQQHVGVVEVLPGYSKLDIQESVPPLPPKPPSTKSKSRTPPPHTPLQLSPPAYTERQSQIYSDLTDVDIEHGLKRNNVVPHVNIYNTLESNVEAPLSPDGHEYQELSPEGEKNDYGEEFKDWRVNNVVASSKVATEKSLFDDPEYSPLKGMCKKDNTVVDPRYIGDYERCPTYTCPTVPKKTNGIDPKYRGDYEWDPTYVPKRSPRRASYSSSGRRRIPKPDEVLKRRKSLEADALHKYTGDYEWSPNYVPVPLRNGSSGPSAMLDQKYSGNYERDPVYMAHVLKRSAQEKQRARSVEYTIPGTISRENSVPRHIPHEYRQLEDNTRDPPQQYARLNSQTPELPQ